MRDYGKVMPKFWTGETGRSLRGDMQAQIIALYLLTTHHGNMIGVFHCPIMYMAHETGSTIEGASKGLKTLIDGDFCSYDEASETVWVHEAAKYQVGDYLKPDDKRVKGLQKDYENIAVTRFCIGFYERYKDAFHLVEKASKIQAPSKPLESPSQASSSSSSSSSIKTIVRKTSSARFEEFWKTWPKSPRKVGKSACQKKWETKNLDEIADSIIQNVKSLSTSKQWRDGFEPSPMTYLNQDRWADGNFDSTESPKRDDGFPSYIRPDGTVDQSKFEREMGWA